MVRTLSVFAALSALVCINGNADESLRGQCVILNTTEHPVVIGLYRPSSEGIEERLINVPPKASVHSISIELTKDEQFVVAYRALSDGKLISRSIPIRVDGHERMNLITKRDNPATPDVLIAYRGGVDPNFRGRDSLNKSLFLPDTEIEAQHILRNANQTTTIVDTPLLKIHYTDKLEQKAEPSDTRETSAQSVPSGKSPPRSP